MTNRMATSVVTAIACIALAGCGTTQRKHGLEELQALGLYAGVVSHHASADSLAIVVLIDETDAVASYSVADPTGRFEIPALRGPYRLLAHVDLDADFQWDPGEPWMLRDNAIDVSRGGDAAANAITLPKTTDRQPPVNVDLSTDELPKGEDIREAALGRVVSVDDPILSPEVGETSLWQPVEFLKAKNAGVLMLEEFDPTKIPVILVNGIGGSPSELMTIAESLDRERFQPVFITYPSGLPIELNGWWLYRLGVEIRARRDFDGEVIFIAHSMGGLVARSMLNRIVSAGGKLPLAFISISTPWGGHAASSEFGARIAAVPVWADLVPGSTFLQNVSTRALPEELHYYLLFGFSGESAMVRGSDDGTVTIPSMLHYPVQDQSRWTYGFAESHTSILKSEKVIAAIQRILDNEAKRVKTSK